MRQLSAQKQTCIQGCANTLAYIDYPLKGKYIFDSIYAFWKEISDSDQKDLSHVVSLVVSAVLDWISWGFGY